VGNVSGETFGARDILWARHRPHFGAVDRHDAPANEPLLPAELHEGRAGGDDRLWIVVPERGNGAVVRGPAGASAKALRGPGRMRARGVAMIGPD